MNSESQKDINSSYISDAYRCTDADDLDLLDNSDDSYTDGNKSCAPLREQDRFLPIANVAKIMKKAIPDNGKIAKDARECVQECVSEFISFITSEASERCHTEKRKTINGEDILFAMNALGFENYIAPLKLYLQKYRENTKPDKNLTGSEAVYEEVPEMFAPDEVNIVNNTNNRQVVNNSDIGETVLYFRTDNIKWDNFNPNL